MKAYIIQDNENGKYYQGAWWKWSENVIDAKCYLKMINVKRACTLMSHVMKIDFTIIEFELMLTDFIEINKKTN